jgi:hypothetical protein
MKHLIGSGDVGSYSFNPAAQSITLAGVPVTLTLEQVLLVTNVTHNVILYNFADATLGASITNNVLTLNVNTAAMSSTDALQILVQLADSEADLLILLRRMCKLLEPLGTVDSNTRQRIAVEAMPTTAVTMAALAGAVATTGTTIPVTGGAAPTIGAATPLPIWIGPVDQRQQITDAARLAYAQGLRANLVFS